MISFIAAEPVSAVFLFSATRISSTSLAQGVIRQLALAHHWLVKANFLTQDPFQYLLFVLDSLPSDMRL